MNMSVVAIIVTLSIACIGFWYLWWNQQKLLQDLHQMKLNLHILQTMPPKGAHETPPLTFAAGGNIRSNSTTSQHGTTPSDAIAAAVSAASQQMSATQDTSPKILHRQFAVDNDSSSEGSYDDDDEDVSSSDEDPDGIDHDGIDHGSDMKSYTAATCNQISDVPGENSGSVSAPPSCLSVTPSVPGSAPLSALSSCTSSVSASVSAPAVFPTVEPPIASHLTAEDLVALHATTLTTAEVNTYLSDSGAEVVTVSADSSDYETAPTQSVGEVTEEGENFLENQGNPAKMGDVLKSRTVSELKKMCQKNSIGVTKPGGYKNKKELIDGIVNKLCCPK
jgi:hypothetical protein